MDGTGKENEKKNRQISSYKRSKTQEKSVCGTRFGITCFQGTPSGIFHHISLSHFFSSLLQNQWQHFHFPSSFTGMQASLDTTCRAVILFPKQKISNYYHCLPSNSMQKACQFESVLSCRLQKSRAMFSNEMPELAEGSSVCKRYNMS